MYQNMAASRAMVGIKRGKPYTNPALGAEF